jgi:hypothetical protein
LADSYVLAKHVVSCMFICEHRSAVHAGMCSQRCKTVSAHFNGSILNEDIAS